MTVYSALSDQELSALLKAGDKSAFTAIYQRYWKLCYQSAFHILKDDEACMDVLQDIFVWLWQNHNKLNIGYLKTYLLTAVKFKMLNVIRQGKLKNTIHKEMFTGELEAEPVDSDMEVKELMGIILEFADQLPAQSKQIFRLSRYEYLSNKEIALKMGISEKTVKNQLNISLKKLRSTLGRLSFWAPFL